MTNYVPNRISTWPTAPVVHQDEPYYPPPGQVFNIADPQHRLDMGQLAVKMAGWGWVLVPLHGKIPTINNWEAQTDAQVGLQNVLNRLESGSANNVGVVTGRASNLMVVDIDQTAWTKKGLVHSGYVIWDYLIQKYGQFDTLQIRTGKGGLHVYFAYESFLDGSALSESKNSFVRGYGLDFRSTGGQVVCPNSIHPNTGHKYTAISGRTDASGRPILSPMPEWLKYLIRTGDVTHL